MNVRNIFGIILIVLGIGFIMGQFQILDFRNWWPVFIMIFGLYIIGKSRDSLFLGSGIFVFGGLMLANKLGFLPWGFWSTFWPVILIMAGIWMLSHRSHRGRRHEIGKDTINEFAVFSGNKQDIVSDNFKGGTATAMFGGVELDLRDCTLAPGALLDLTAVFGGIELRVPSNWQIESSGLPLFGAMENKTRRRIDPEENKPILRIKYLAMFGGIEIKD